MPVRRSRVDTLELLALRGRRREPRPARRLGDVRPRDRGRARRPLPDAAAHRGRAVLRGRRRRRSGSCPRPRRCRSCRRSRWTPDEAAAIRTGRQRARSGHAHAARRRARRRRLGGDAGLNVARSPAELERKDRAPSRSASSTASTCGHRRVIAEAVESGLTPTVVTFDPHPRRVLGYGVELLCTLERRLELLAELGVEDTLVVEFTLETQRLEAEEFAARVPRGDRRAGGRRRRGLPLRAPAGAATSSCCARSASTCGPSRRSRASRRRRSGTCSTRATWRRRPRLLGRPPRSRASSWRATPAAGRSASRPRTSPSSRTCSSRCTGSTPGFAAGHRAAISIGTNPHYGGDELRIEAFLLGFAGDLYGKRLVVELWQRLRDEQVFDSEQALIDQIARDVEATERPSVPV